MKKDRNIRLYVDQPLRQGLEIGLSAATSHYLCTVMRCNVSDSIRCFNETSGEYSALLTKADKKQSVLKIGQQLKQPKPAPDIWLLFAPLKKDKMDFVIEKAVELGVAKIIPVMTARTNSDKVRTERLTAQAIEAAEQSQRLSVPEIKNAVPLKKILDNWEKKRILFFMDERRQGEDALKAFEAARNRAAAILVGPEGGFDEEETSLLNNCSFVQNINLGPRILRAETASAAALAVWQAVAGDWRKEKK